MSTRINAGQTSAPQPNPDPCQSSVENELLGQQRSEQPAADGKGARTKTRAATAAAARDGAARTATAKPGGAADKDCYVNSRDNSAMGRLARAAGLKPRVSYDRNTGCLTRSYERTLPGGATISSRAQFCAKRDGGVTVSGHLLEVSQQLLPKVRIAVTLGAAAAEVRGDKTGVGTRAALNGAAASVTVGDDLSKKRGNDEQLTVGISAGVSSGAVFRREDRDGDGKTEKTVAVDAGMVSGELKWENSRHTFLPSEKVKDELQQQVRQAKQILRSARQPHRVAR